ncbi:MAG: cyclase family protein [Deinococcus sp.]
MTLPPRFHDVSRPLRSGAPTWPGDAPFTLEPAARIGAGQSVNTSILSTPTHIGTHVDAPWHYDDGGAKLQDVPLDIYIGPCRVLDARGHSLVPASLLDGLESLPPRLLLHTGQPGHWETFPEDFAALSPELVRRAAGLGVQLIGTDAPSVDPLTSKTLAAHMAFRDTGLSILEGLDLSRVQPGDYTLVCLPLPLVDMDGAPARVVLFGGPA